MSSIGQEVSAFDVEPGRRYRFTFKRAIVPGSRLRTLEAVLGSSFWGEVPLLTDAGVIRVHRDLVTCVREVF